MRFTSRQLRKISDQMRLTSWAQGAILYTDLHVFSRDITMALIFCFWVTFQIAALCVDKNVDGDNEDNEGEIE